MSCVSIRLHIWVGLLHLRREINEGGTITHPRDDCSLQFQPSFFGRRIPYFVMIYIVLPVPCSGFGLDFRVGEWLASNNDNLSQGVGWKACQVNLIDAFLSPYLQVNPSFQARAFTFRKSLSLLTLFSFPQYTCCILWCTLMYIDERDPRLPKCSLTKMSVCDSLH